MSIGGHGVEGRATIDLFKQMALKAVDGVLSAALIEELWTAITQRIDAHSMTNYRSLVAALCPQEQTEGKAEGVDRGTCRRRPLTAQRSSKRWVGMSSITHPFFTKELLLPLFHGIQSAGDPLPRWFSPCHGY